MRDFLEFYSFDKGAKYVTDEMAQGRRVCLLGIDVAFIQDGGSFHMDPVVPCAGPLLELIKGGRGTTFRFDRENQTWSAE